MRPSSRRRLAPAGQRRASHAAAKRASAWGQGWYSSRGRARRVGEGASASFRATKSTREPRAVRSVESAACSATNVLPAPRGRGSETRVREGPCRCSAASSRRPQAPAGAGPAPRPRPPAARRAPAAGAASACRAPPRSPRTGPRSRCGRPWPPRAEPGWPAGRGVSTLRCGFARLRGGGGATQQCSGGTYYTGATAAQPTYWLKLADNRPGVARAAGAGASECSVWRVREGDTEGDTPAVSE